jgi:hypothetical protein
MTRLRKMMLELLTLRCKSNCDTTAFFADYWACQHEANPPLSAACYET